MAKGIKTGGRQIGTPNKLTAEIKERLAAIISEATDSIDIDKLAALEKIRLIEIGLKYLLPTMKQVEERYEPNLNSIDFRSILRFEE